MSNMKQALYFNGRISGSTASEWIFCENGKIRKMGRGEPPVGLGKDIARIDLQCGFISPGLIDSHIHIHLLGEQKQHVALHSCQSAKDLLEKVSEHCKKNPELKVVRGFGWDEGKWRDASLPTLQELDALSAGRPMLLTKIDGHAGLASSALLQKAEITRGTRIDGGWIATDSDGNPTGLLKEKAYEKTLNSLPAPSAAEQDAALLLAQRECIRRGITSIHESAATLSTIESFARCDQENKLKLFINAALYGDAIDPGLQYGATSNERIISGEQHWRAYAVKFFMDGSLGSRTALLHHPYNDDPSTSGLQLMSTEALCQGIERALTHGFQPLVHAIGPKACHLALGAYELALKNVSAEAKELRFRLEHAEVMIPQDILFAAKLGALMAIQPKHITSDSAWLEARLGRTVAKCAGTWNSMMKAGLRLAGGSDAPMDDLSPFAGMVAASHRPEHFPEEAISRADAIKLYTENAAYAAGQERVMGSLREGLLANFAVFDRDIKVVADDKLLQTTVLQTVIFGESEHSVFF